MTIVSRVNRATMDGNGVATTLAIDFPFHSVEDLIVIETIIATGAETTKALSTDYTVDGAQDDAGHFPDGGEITFTTPPASTVRMVVYRDPPMLQGVVLQETGKIPVKAAIESPLDKLTMIDQRLSERIDRALRLSDGDSLEMGRLPVKGVRASRYMGFDGDGNPTMMPTPTGLSTPIAQLAESPVADLPAAGSAGTLRKVTTGTRGIWMDTGAQWISINGGMANVKDFGAKGDNVADDSIAVQAAIDSVPDGGTVFFPPGTYRGSEWTAPSRVSLVGAGPEVSVLYNIGTSNEDLVTFADLATSNDELRFGRVAGLGLTGSASSGAGLVAENPYQFIVDQCRVYSNGGIGIDIKKGTGTSTYGQSVWITQSFVNFNRKGGIRLAPIGVASGADVIEIRNCSINQNGYYGVFLNRAIMARLVGCEFADYYYGSIIPAHQAVPVAINGGIAIVIDQGSFEGNEGQSGTPNSDIKCYWDGDAQTDGSNATQMLTVCNSTFKPPIANGDLNHIRFKENIGAHVFGNAFEGGGSGAVYAYEFAALLNNSGIVFGPNFYHSSLGGHSTGTMSGSYLWHDLLPGGITGTNQYTYGAQSYDVTTYSWWQRHTTNAHHNYRMYGDGSIARGLGAAAPDILFLIGAGSPEGVVTAGIGSIYQRTNGGANTSMYVKESGTGNTGWVAK